MSAPTYSPEVPSAQQPPSAMLPDQNQLVKAIQGPAAEGLTSFPDKHLQIPPSARQTDHQPRQEHIPVPHQHRDYIVEEPPPKLESSPQLDPTDPYKIPILAACLYLLFNAPVARRALRSLIPIPASANGSYTFQAQIVTALLFGGAVYASTEAITWF